MTAFRRIRICHSGAAREGPREPGIHKQALTLRLDSGSGADAPSRNDRILHAGGGRKLISCLAASATTSGGFCSFIEWIAQNRS